ncbi:MAG: Uma2 family endonuclease [Chloroflexi bacterium]|nr:Uma2 family endonuclease [Chloroflexota bacterium]
MVIERVRQMSVEEFLDFAENSEDRYEYIDGEPRQMTGGKLDHFRIIHRIQVILESRLADTDFEAIAGGMLVKAGETRLLAPDVSVVRGEPETESDTRVLLNPILVVEVTSPSSIDYDRVLKREFYRSMDSIEAYLVIDQHRVLAELYTPAQEGWHLQQFSDLNAVVPLETLGCALPLAEVYRGITFTGESLTGGAK